MVVPLTEQTRRLQLSARQSALVTMFPFLLLCVGSLFLNVSWSAHDLNVLLILLTTVHLGFTQDFALLVFALLYLSFL